MYKYIGLAPPQGVGVPSYDKSWIRPYTVKTFEKTQMSLYWTRKLGKLNCWSLSWASKCISVKDTLSHVYFENQLVFARNLAHVCFCPEIGPSNVER